MLAGGILDIILELSTTCGSMVVEPYTFVARPMDAEFIDPMFAGIALAMPASFVEREPLRALAK